MLFGQNYVLFLIQPNEIQKNSVLLQRNTYIIIDLND